MTKDRQRQILWVAAGVVLLFAVIQWFIRPILNHSEKLDSRIELSEQRLEQLVGLERTYRQVLAENAKVSENLSGRQKDFTLFAFLEALASRDGLKDQIEYMRPSVKTLSDTHQEEQVEMRLNGVTLANLVPYLYHLETAVEQVRIKRITIRPQQRNKSLLEVSLVVVTHTSREGERRGGGRSAQLLIQLGGYVNS
ncbi:MAG: type II secretion system protein GspM [Syntrophobacterales bacterium]|jgi:general secretion pathway protein M